MDALSRKWDGKYLDWWTDPDGKKTVLLPDWSGDIGVAWQLVDEVISSNLGWEPSIYYETNDGEYPPIWNARFDKYFRHIAAVGSTPALAICLAWIEWKKSVKNENH